ncbi:uncharacterized protein BX663DRAFT_492731 [Cokeromyces recurvatus]|uniref:uncharacterized protein n=1 Tax=Cokeromyces recurvatus TaxID=90255 RepID=UPI00221F5475|nr:uncharacterized protein BX663DRAFT_492731 [Cokeromyces recurvatus]KAI7908017.1 hypothetical protein BX663DRAFT_492731 [Cokeromyces recurvatus]
MYLSLLPSEILDLIVSNILNDNKKYQCLHVCKNWYRALRPSLYRNVVLTSRRQFIQFLNCIQQSEEIHLYIRHLYMKDNVGLSQNEIESLPYLFPLLESLYFNPKLWRYQHNVSSYHVIKKNTWKRMKALPPLDCIQTSYPLLSEYGFGLEELILKGNIVNPMHRTKCSTKGATTSALLHLLTLTPHLKRLTMYGRDHFNLITSRQANERTEFTLDDIIHLHALLPSLVQLTLIDVVLTISSSPLDQIPANQRMRKLDINHSSLAHSTWIESIAKLYPHIVDLNLNVKWDPAYKQTCTWRDIESIQEGFHRIATECRSLESVNLGQLESVLKITTESKFFDSLSRVTSSGLVELNNICLDRNMYGKLASNSFATFMACTSPIKTRTLGVQLWRDLGNIENVMKTIGTCHRLTELELSCGRYCYSWNYGCDIDTIVKYCPQLERLSLSIARLGYSKRDEGDGTITVSNIKSIYLNQIHFTTEAMHAIAKYCPQLEYFELIHCVKDKDSLANKIHIALPYQHLKTLKLEHVYLRPSPYVEKCNIDAALLAVNYSNRNEHDWKRQSKRLCTRWYHLCCQRNKSTTTKHVRQLRRLDYIKSEKVKNYVMKYEDWDHLEENSIRRTYREFDYWDSDIPYGFVQIECKYVDNLIFNEVIL